MKIPQGDEIINNGIVHIKLASDKIGNLTCHFILNENSLEIIGEDVRQDYLSLFHQTDGKPYNTNNKRYFFDEKLGDLVYENKINHDDRHKIRSFTQKKFNEEKLNDIKILINKEIQSMENEPDKKIRKNKLDSLNKLISKSGLVSIYISTTDIYKQLQEKGPSQLSERNIKEGKEIPTGMCNRCGNTTYLRESKMDTSKHYNYPSENRWSPFLKNQKQFNCLFCDLSYIIGNKPSSLIKIKDYYGCFSSHNLLTLSKIVRYLREKSGDNYILSDDRGYIISVSGLRLRGKLSGIYDSTLYLFIQICNHLSNVCENRKIVEDLFKDDIQLLVFSSKTPLKSEKFSNISKIYHMITYCDMAKLFNQLYAKKDYTRNQIANDILKEDLNIFNSIVKMSYVKLKEYGKLKNNKSRTSFYFNEMYSELNEFLKKYVGEINMENMVSIIDEGIKYGNDLGRFFFKVKDLALLFQMRNKITPMEFIMLIEKVMFSGLKNELSSFLDVPSLINLLKNMTDDEFMVFRGVLLSNTIYGYTKQGGK